MSSCLANISLMDPVFTISESWNINTEFCAYNLQARQLKNTEFYRNNWQRFFVRPKDQNIQKHQFSEIYLEGACTIQQMFAQSPPSSCPHLPEDHHNLKRQKDDRVWAVHSRELKVFFLLFFYHLFTMVNNIRISKSQGFSCQIHSLNVGCHWSLIVTLRISLVIQQNINIFQHHIVTMQWGRKVLICWHKF